MVRLGPGHGTGRLRGLCIFCSPRRDGFEGEIEDGEVFPPLPPERAWLRWRCQVEVEADSGTVGIRTLPQSEPEDPPEPSLPQELPDAPAYPPTAFPDYPEPDPAMNPSESEYEEFSAASAESASWEAVIGNTPGGTESSDDGKTFVQKRAVGMPVVYLVGDALRVGYPIPCPALTRVKSTGSEAEITPVAALRLDAGEGFAHGVVGNIGGLPVYGAKWRLRYLLPENPKGGIVPPVNPMEGRVPDPDE
jgi:hypothetical protein